MHLSGIEPRIPLTVAPSQLKVIEKIISGLPTDDAGNKARVYFRDAKNRGRITVR